MDPATATAIGLFVAKEIIQTIQENKAIDEATLAKNIAVLILKIQSIQETIKGEMAQYGGKE